ATLGSWASGPAPASVIVRAGAGAMSGSDRVEVIWGANAPKNTWLEVTVLAGQDTGLSTDDVFFFGKEIGAPGVSSSSGGIQINNYDLMATSAKVSTAVAGIGITSLFDYNRDGRIDAMDVTTIQKHFVTLSNGLQFINISGNGATQAAIGQWIV